MAGCGSVSLHPVTAWCGLLVWGLRLLLMLARPALIPTSTRWVGTDGSPLCLPVRAVRTGSARGGRSGSAAERAPARPPGPTRSTWQACWGSTSQRTKAGPSPTGHPVTSSRFGSASTKRRRSRWAHLTERRPLRPRGCVLGPTRAALPVTAKGTGGGGQINDAQATQRRSEDRFTQVRGYSPHPVMAPALQDRLDRS